MTIALIEDLGVAKTSLEDAADALRQVAEALDDGPLRSLIAKTVFGVDDSVNTIACTLADHKNGSDDRHANTRRTPHEEANTDVSAPQKISAVQFRDAKADLEASAFALSMCGFLFEQMHAISPSDTESDVALHQFVDIGKVVAGTAETAAFNAIDAIRKEANHE